MTLEEFDISKLKRLDSKQRIQKINEFEEKKTILIEKYIKLQDILDEYNQKIYNISCEIEQLNLVIKELSSQKVYKRS